MSARNTSRIPSYRLHKPTGLAVVRLSGRDFYLGRHGSPESKADYERLIAEWLSNGRQLALTHPVDSPASPITISELIIAYWEHAEHYYVKKGEPTSTLHSIKAALRPLHQLYRDTAPTDFGPLALKAVRQSMIDAGLSQSAISKYVGIVRRMFRWGAENQLVPSGVHQGLQAVSGLRRGRSEARDPEPVRPVPEANIEAVLPRLPRQLRAMIQVQMLSGMRPGEVVIMRARDLDTSGKIWMYWPDSHKTEHHGHARIVYLGPRAQELIQPFLKRDLSAYLFSPTEAEAERRIHVHRRRRTPLSCGNRPGMASKHRSRRQFHDHYTTDSYRRAIHRACGKAGVLRWSPNQLRHNAATHLRKEFDVDVARIILGHQSPAVTEIYAERDMAKAAEVMMKIG